ALLAAGLSFAAPVQAQSLGERFKSLFGGGSSEEKPATSPTEATGEDDLTCPPGTGGAGASTYKVAAPGKEAVGNDLRFQVTITKTARECTIQGGQITARIGKIGSASW